MKFFFSILLFFSIGAAAQTTATKATLRSKPATTSPLTVFKVDTVFYVADPKNTTSTDDNDKVLVSTSGLRFVKLVKSIYAVPQPSGPTLEQAVAKAVNDELAKRNYVPATALPSIIGKQVSDSLNKNIIKFNGLDFYLGTQQEIRIKRN